MLIRAFTVRLREMSGGLDTQVSRGVPWFVPQGSQGKLGHMDAAGRQFPVRVVDAFNSPSPHQLQMLYCPKEPEKVLFYAEDGKAEDNWALIYFVSRLPDAVEWDAFIDSALDSGDPSTDNVFGVAESNEALLIVDLTNDWEVTFGSYDVKITLNDQQMVEVEWIPDEDEDD